MPRDAVFCCAFNNVLYVLASGIGGQLERRMTCVTRLLVCNFFTTPGSLLKNAICNNKCTTPAMHRPVFRVYALTISEPFSALQENLFCWDFWKTDGWKMFARPLCSLK
uniref:Uncharacterized protein n=1 Tax=Cacopsylla melanoneura TaxID=428564 RepID=A0A8D9ELK8_9HEMI